MITSSKNPCLINSQLTVPPPSTKSFFIFLFTIFFRTCFRLTFFSPEIIISIGYFRNRSRFFLVIFFETAIIVGTFLHVLMILEFDGIVPRESRIIRVGFSPFEYLTVRIGLSRSNVFVPIKIPSTFERNL